MLRHVVLLLSLAVVARRVSAQDAPPVFDKQAFIKDHFKYHEGLQQNFTADLPSCKESFYSIQAVEKEADCQESEFATGDSSAVFFCTPACFESLRFNGIECESEEAALELNLKSRVLENARNGTLDAKDRQLVEAYIFEFASQVPDIFPGIKPGFLSTQTKAKEFFSDNDNYALVANIMNTEDGTQEYLKLAKECLATGSSVPPSPQPGSSGVSSNMGYTLSFAVVAGLCLLTF